jgi:hypothetical protein
MATKIGFPFFCASAKAAASKVRGLSARAGVSAKALATISIERRDSMCAPLMVF